MGSLSGSKAGGPARIWVNPMGFSNNAALGRLILDGGISNSLFQFSAVFGANALYVDRIDFENFTTNTDAAGNLIGVQIDPGMVIYYAQANQGGIPASAKLDGKNGGRLRWVTGFAGFFSSTNLIYGDGSTNTFNQHLVELCDGTDSDGDMLPNCVDPEPLPASPPPVILVNLPMMPLGWDGNPGTGPAPTPAIPLLPYPGQNGGSGGKLSFNAVKGPYNGLFYDSDGV